VNDGNMVDGNVVDDRGDPKKLTESDVGGVAERVFIPGTPFNMKVLYICSIMVDIFPNCS